MNAETNKTGARDALYIAAEEEANRFNLICLGILCLLMAITEVLNELGVFTASVDVMRPSAAVGFLFFTLPGIVAFVHDRARRDREPLRRHDAFKFFILVCVYLGIAVLCITLTLHTVLLMALPPILAAQYRDQKRLIAWTLAASVLLVPVGVYGGFFFGMPDRNLLKGLTDAEAAVLANRLVVATPKRMVELFTHYTLPRLLCIIAIDLLASGIPRRTGRMLSRQAELSREVQAEMTRLNELQSHVIEDLAAVIETRDEETGNHVARTKKYVGMIARALQRDPAWQGKLTDADVEEMCTAAPLHDVGKIAISDTILLKPARLTDEEFAVMKSHTTRGGKMIRRIFSNLEDPAFLKRAEEIAVSHHEKWDGSGYPAGLKGEEIPLSARIMAVADVYDALVSKRVYKKPIAPEAALDLIESESGTHFDPELVRVVHTLRPELIAAAKQEFANENKGTKET